MDVLRSVVGTLFLSVQVYDEIQDGLQDGYDFYVEVEEMLHPFNEEGWLRLTSLQGEDELRLFGGIPKQLHGGEASALAIARNRAWVLLTDDHRARRQATEWGITLSGTLGVLIQATRKGVVSVEEANDILKQMIARGYHSPCGDLNHLLASE